MLGLELARRDHRATSKRHLVNDLIDPGSKYGCNRHLHVSLRVKFFSVRDFLRCILPSTDFAMGPLSYLIAFVCIALGAYYWFNNQSSSPKSTTSSSSRTTTKSTNSLDFDKDCTIRALTPSDLTSVKALVNGQGGCGYFKDHSLTPYLDELDSKHLSFGVEHVSSGKIICAQFILMVDDNETGYVLGAMFDPKYKANIRVCYMRISNDIQDKLSTKFEDLGKHRTLVVEAEDDEDYKDDYCNNR